MARATVVLKPVAAASADHGLSESEAQRLLEKSGYNELAEEAPNPVLKFLSYFWGPIPWMIEIAIVLSALVQHWTDMTMILILLLMNAGVGFWEEFQAGATLAALKAQLALQAQVKRDGVWRVIPARELVPKDVIHLRMGQIIPADATLLEGEPIEVDQSALTGESLPVSHKSGDLVYSSSIIQRGEIDAVVSATGAQTYMGRTAHLVQTAVTTSHFQRAVLKIGDYLIVLALALVILILGVALFRGDDMLTTLQFALILTVAAIPVAMPAVLSVTMAVGARTLAARDVIVSHLASVEELAGMDVLCSDKTGTHQDPGCLDVVANKSPEVVRIYVPPDANSLLSVADHCLRSVNYINVIVADKQVHLQYLDMDSAIVHCTKGAGIWDWASNDQGAEPDIIMASCGDVPTMESLAATALLRQYLPAAKVRFVNVVDLFKLVPNTEHPHGFTDREFEVLFGADTPVVFNFHSYPWLIHRLTYRRPGQHNIHVRGYKEKGNIVTPLELAIRNQTDRFSLAIDAIDRIPRLRVTGSSLRETLLNQRVACANHAFEFGIDPPEITNWQWPS
jgi:XFP-like protein/E1-E2 ATPase/D-xylulose 5-phosphate/D-fructose 6-phosphate phosphoketolase-like protein/cation transport ATPase-like protein